MKNEWGNEWSIIPKSTFPLTLPSGACILTFLPLSNFCSRHFLFFWKLSWYGVEKNKCKGLWASKTWLLYCSISDFKYQNISLNFYSNYEMKLFIFKHRHTFEQCHVLPSPPTVFQPKVYYFPSGDYFKYTRLHLSRCSLRFQFCLQT